MGYGRPPKTIYMVEGHRTKKEKKVREKAETELLTGYNMKESLEVRVDPVAHREFQRLRKLFKSIGKDDDLSGNIINTHCLLHSECKKFEQLKETLTNDINKLTQKYEEGSIEYIEYIDRKTRLQEQLFSCDKKIMDKRKMILDISKENIMTIQSMLRSIPKQPEQQAKSKMAAMLEKRQAK